MNYKRADDAFSKYIRKRDADENGECTCPLCHYQDSWKRFTAGHYIKRRHLSVRWYEDNAFAVCPACNFQMEGNTVLQNRYGQWIAMEIGPERWGALMVQKNRDGKLMQCEIDEIAKYFREKIKELA